MSRQARFLGELKRTHRCGELRASDVGREVVLFGWVASRRDHGGCVFIDLRDREGITQVVFDPQYADAAAWAPRDVKPPATLDVKLLNEAHDLAEQIRPEWVVGVRGIVFSRGANKNPKIATGDIEVVALE